MRYVPVLWLTLSGTHVFAAEFAVSTRAAANRGGPYISLPFDSILDINGEEIVLETNGAIKPFAILDDGGDTLVSIDHRLSHCACSTAGADVRAAVQPRHAVRPSRFSFAPPLRSYPAIA